MGGWSEQMFDEACRVYETDRSEVLTSAPRIPNVKRDLVAWYMLSNGADPADSGAILGITPGAVRQAAARGSRASGGGGVKRRVCEDCGEPSMGGGRWCFACFRDRKDTGRLSPNRPLNRAYRGRMG